MYLLAFQLTCLPSLSVTGPQIGAVSRPNNPVRHEPKQDARYIVDPPIEPVRGFNFVAGLVCTDPVSGDQLLALSNDNDLTGGSLLLLDYENNTATRYPFPVGKIAWGMAQLNQRMLILASAEKAAFLFFDLKTRSYGLAVDIPGAESAWNCVVQPDGKVYAGTSPNAELAVLDPETGRVSMVKSPTDHENEYLRNLSRIDSNRLLARFGMKTPTTKIFDIRQNRYVEPPAELSRTQSGFTFGDFFVSDRSVFRKDELRPLVPGNKGYPRWGRPQFGFDSKLSTTMRLILVSGDSLFYAVEDGDAPEFFATAHTAGGVLWGIDRNDMIIGTRGQSYFVVPKGAKNIVLKQIPVEPPVQEVYFLRVTSDSSLWTGPPFGQTLCRINAFTLQFENTDQMSSIGTGEIYDVGFFQHVLIGASYSRGEIIEYRPDSPWSPLMGNNPRTLVTLYDSGYVRPVGGVSVSVGGTAFIGWSSKYGTYGGAISATNIETGMTRVLRDPFGARGLSSVALSGPFLYAGTNSWGNGLPNQTGVSPVFGIVDTATLKVVSSYSLVDGISITQVLPMPSIGKIVVGVDGWIRLFDIARKEFVKTFKSVPHTSRTFTATDGSTVCYGSGDNLVLLHLDTGVKDTIAAVGGKINKLESGWGYIFASSGTNLFRVRRNGD